MKIVKILLLFSTLLGNSVFIFGQSFCYTPSPLKAINLKSLILSPTPQPCKIYFVNVYIHRIDGNSGNGYSNSIDNTIISNLNSSFNSYGIFFSLSGSRRWADDYLSNSSTPKEAIASNIITNSLNSFQNNCINIYVLPSNSQMTAGFVPSENKKMLIIGGIRAITHCDPNSTINYELASGKVVAHEMGHCFGLIHTFQNNGDDGLSDTSIDNVQNQSCINPISCIFTSCSSCGISSNPTSQMTNFMSYTTPNCMSIFSPMQVDLMRYNLNTSQIDVVYQTQTTPNLQSMTRDGSVVVNTFNSIPSGYHTINTNLFPNLLTTNVSWVPNTSSVWWGISGVKNINAWIQPSSGQNMMFTVSASNICGSSTRNITFATQSGYMIYSTASIQNQMTIEFDNTINVDVLPQTISIVDEKDFDIEKSIDVKTSFKNKQFINGNKLFIDVKGLKRGVKIIRFEYMKDGKLIDFKTERVFFID
jgi:hypothetical protein